MNAELKSKVDNYIKNTVGRKTVGRELILELIGYIQRLKTDQEHLVNNYNHTVNTFKKLNIEYNKLKTEHESLVNLHKSDVELIDNMREQNKALTEQTENVFGMSDKYKTRCNQLEADLKLERDSVKRLIASIDKLEKTKQNQKILISFLFVGIIALALAFVGTII